MRVTGGSGSPPLPCCSPYAEEPSCQQHPTTLAAAADTAGKFGSPAHTWAKEQMVVRVYRCLPVRHPCNLESLESEYRSGGIQGSTRGRNDEEFSLSLGCILN